MCDCLSTVSLFFHTVAPGLFSSGKSTSGVTPGPASHELATIGGGGGGKKIRTKRSKYSRFGDSENATAFGNETFNANVEGEAPNENRSDGGASWLEDGGSDRAIVHTTTTDVSFSKADAGVAM